MKALRIILAAVLLLSSIGVTVTSVACAKGSGKQTASCQYCKAGATTKKSCCIYEVKRLSLKADFGKSEAPRVTLTPIAMLPVFNVAAYANGVVSTHYLITSSPPLIAVEKCVLISTFRI